MLRRLLRRRVVQDRSGLACSSLYKKVDAGEFLSPVRLGPRAVAWVEDEVNEWIEARIAEREAAEARECKRAEEAEKRDREVHTRRLQRRGPAR